MSAAPGLTKARPWPTASAVEWVRREADRLERHDGIVSDGLLALIARGCCLSEQLFRYHLREAIGASFDEVDEIVSAIRAAPSPIGPVCPYCGAVSETAARSATHPEENPRATASQRVLEYLTRLGQPALTRAIAAETGVNKNTLSSVLAGLRARGLVELSGRTNRAQWRVVSRSMGSADGVARPEKNITPNADRITPSTERVREHLQAGSIGSSVAIAAAIGLHQNTVQAALRSLQARGLATVKRAGSRTHWMSAGREETTAEASGAKPDPIPQSAPRSEQSAAIVAAADAAPVRALRVLPVAELTSVEDHFRCTPFGATLSARSCISRQQLAGSTNEERMARSAYGVPLSKMPYARCGDCDLGRDVATRIGGAVS